MSLKTANSWLEGKNQWRVRRRPLKSDNASSIHVLFSWFAHGGGVTRTSSTESCKNKKVLLLAWNSALSRKSRSELILPISSFLTVQGTVRSWGSAVMSSNQWDREKVSMSRGMERGEHCVNILRTTPLRPLLARCSESAPQMILLHC